MLSLSKKAFEALVEEALAGIPKRFRKLIGNVEIAVRDRPGPEAAGMRDTDLLLGLYVGPPRSQLEDPTAPSEMPARILLYQANLQSVCGDEDTLRREISLTLRHELAHYFGFTDEDLKKTWPEGA